MIEHFTKWVELVPIPEMSSKYTAKALKRVLTMFGAPAEVLTDQGEEFEGKFAELLESLLIDHRVTSRNHPQSDGLAERMVQTIKVALCRYCLTYNKFHWDQFLPWIAMGYRMSRQTSLTGISPYFLLFGRHPVVRSRVWDIIRKQSTWTISSSRHGSSMPALKSSRRPFQRLLTNSGSRSTAISCVTRTPGPVTSNPSNIASRLVTWSTYAGSPPIPWILRLDA
jgi:transposase InsO family protein